LSPAHTLSIQFILFALIVEVKTGQLKSFRWLFT